jgi:two-component sensor histidine kinase
MASCVSRMTPALNEPASGDDLLLRETNHRCSNDLQLVVSLLALQSRRAVSQDVRHALADAMERVAILARARSALHDERTASLDVAVRQVCEALQPQVEFRSILISFEARCEADEISANHTTTLALVVNELTTNAIKHAFENSGPGVIRVLISRDRGGDVIITVDDDGLPFPDAAISSGGMGMGLAKRLMASIGGTFSPPPLGSKTFELRLPSSVD